MFFLSLVPVAVHAEGEVDDSSDVMPIGIEEEMETTTLPYWFKVWEDDYHYTIYESALPFVLVPTKFENYTFYTFYNGGVEAKQRTYRYMTKDNYWYLKSTGSGEGYGFSDEQIARATYNHDLKLKETGEIVFPNPQTPEEETGQGEWSTVILPQVLPIVLIVVAMGLLILFLILLVRWVIGLVRSYLR